MELYKSKSIEQKLAFMLLVKAFEILVEYSWRELKKRVEDDGGSAPSPKSAIREAARYGFIDKPERWIACIGARNDSVHDYFGISEKDFVLLSQELLVLVEQL